MYYYFSSNFPAVIKLNGIYYGQITDTVKQIDVKTEQPTFVEVCSLVQTEKSINFILDDCFLQSPPESICITDLKGGYLLKFNRRYNENGFSVICQQKFSNMIATIFCENGYKLSIESTEDFYAENIFSRIDSAEIERIELQGEQFIAVRIFNGKQIVSLYKIGCKIEKVFSTECDQAIFQNELTVIENHLDIAKHKTVSKWNFVDGEFQLSSREVNRKEDFNTSQLPDKILPFAFAEELLVGGEINDFLTENMCKNADKLKGFLGEFIGVMPPPLFRNSCEVGFIYKQAERKFIIRYFVFEIEDNKIKNIKES